MTLLKQISELTCASCIFLKENKCTSANSKQNEEEKFKTQEACFVFTPNVAIDDIFVCNDFINKNNEK